MMSNSTLETRTMDAPTNDSIHMVAWCPYSDQRVITSEWQQTTVMKDETIWWKCPACKGWHVNLMRRDEPVEELQDVAV